MIAVSPTNFQSSNSWEGYPSARWVTPGLLRSEEDLQNASLWTGKQWLSLTTVPWGKITGDQSTINLSGFNNDSGFITSESDPVFGASPASTITSTQISQWDAAYLWGDHAAVGYLTTESDPVFGASPAAGITNTNITNWNTAHGWGNHASQGYLTASSSPTITGAWTFDANVTLGSGGGYFIESTNTYYFGANNIAVSMNNFAGTSYIRVLGNEAEMYGANVNLTGNVYIYSGYLTIDNPSSATYDVRIKTGYDFDGWCRFEDGAGAVRASIGRDNQMYLGGIGVAGNKVWHQGNDGPGSGLDADTVDGIHASGFVSTTTNSTLNSDTRNTRGPTRLFRSDSDNNYSVQVDWTGAYWRLRGFSGDTFHAECQVGFADNASTLDNLNSSQFVRSDTETILSTHTRWQDNQEIRLGTGADFRIDHDGSTTWFRSYNHGSNIYFWQEDSGGTARYSLLLYSGASTYVQLRYNSGIRLETTSGGIQVTGTGSASTDWVISSDRRLKKDIVTIDRAIDCIKALRGVRYTRKDDKSGKRQVGMIAQEVEKVLPELVTESALKEGGKPYKSLSYPRMTGVLVQAMNEQNEVIEQQGARIAALEKMVKELANGPAH